MKADIHNANRIEVILTDGMVVVTVDSDTILRASTDNQIHVTDERAKKAPMFVTNPESANEKP